MARVKSNQDVRHMTLGMDGAWDAYRKLEWEIETYKQAASLKVPQHAEAYREIRFPMYAAINAAATAWSLIEWFWFEVEHDPASRSQLLTLAGAGGAEGLAGLKSALRRSVPSIDACHQIAHATKHAQLGDVTQGFSTAVSYGFWQSAGWFYISTHARLHYEEEADGEPIEVLFEVVREYWLQMLTLFHIPDRVKQLGPNAAIR